MARKKKTGAIPTMYAGVQFRSRLEARYAAFFDLIMWRWEYEPIDLDGYIPDFLVGDELEYLIEVKPITRWPCHVKGCTKCNDAPRDDYDDARTKIEQSGWAAYAKHAVIVGAAPLRGPLDVGPLIVDGLGRVVASDLWLVGTAFNFMRHELLNEWRAASNSVQWRGEKKQTFRPVSRQAADAAEIASFFRNLADEVD